MDHEFLKTNVKYFFRNIKTHLASNIVLHPWKSESPNKRPWELEKMLALEDFGGNGRYVELNEDCIYIDGTWF
jgi:hypothetical protein